MEKLNPHVLALSLGITAAVLYLICLVLVAVTPMPLVVTFVNSLQHSIDVSGLITASKISISGILTGIFGWFIISAITGYIFAYVFNMINNKLKL